MDCDDNAATMRKRAQIESNKNRHICHTRMCACVYNVHVRIAYDLWNSALNVVEREWRCLHAKWLPCVLIQIINVTNHTWNRRSHHSIFIRRTAISCFLSGSLPLEKSILFKVCSEHSWMISLQLSLSLAHIGISCLMHSKKFDTAIWFNDISNYNSILMIEKHFSFLFP